MSSRKINRKRESIPYISPFQSSGSGETEQSEIRFGRSTNCGETWTVNPLALSTGSRLVQNPQIAVSPVDGSV